MASTTLSTARAIAQRLRENQFQAWLVGGCVRDLLLGRSPKDYDISTDAPPQAVAQLFPGAALVGAHFGVVLVDGVEVATFRSDGLYADGRRPEAVWFETDAAKDVLRRDFTINALMLDPLLNDLSPSAIVDHVGGLQDLRDGVIRAIGDPRHRFDEDHLRMLRAVRFAARFRFSIEPKTLDAIRQMPAKIHRIAPERTRDELIRILVEGGARYGLELLNASGLLQEILPEVAAMIGVEQPPEFHPEGDVWTHTLIMMAGLSDPSPALALGVLLHDVGKPPTFRIADRIRFDGHVEAGQEIARRILERLRITNSDAAQVDALIANHMRFKDVPKMRESSIQRFLRLPRFEEHLELHRLDCSSSHNHLGNYEIMKARFEQSPPEQIRPQRLLTGSDLIAAGYRPSPAFSKMLDAAEDAQLERRVATREEALELVQRLFGDPPSGTPEP